MHMTRVKLINETLSSNSEVTYPENGQWNGYSKRPFYPHRIRSQSTLPSV